MLGWDFGPHDEETALCLGMVVAKKLILVEWKFDSLAPCFKKLLNEMPFVTRMETTVYENQQMEQISKHLGTISWAPEQHSSNKIICDICSYLDAFFTVCLKLLLLASMSYLNDTLLLGWQPFSFFHFLFCFFLCVPVFVLMRLCRNVEFFLTLI